MAWLRGRVGLGIKVSFFASLKLLTFYRWPLVGRSERNWEIDIRGSGVEPAPPFPCVSLPDAVLAE